MPDHFEAHLTRMTADQYWAALQEMGWVAEVPEAFHGTLETRVRDAFTADPVHAWEALAATSFDSECIYGTDPEGLSYHTQLSALAQVAPALFHPTTIHNEEVNGHIRVSFEHQGRSYHYDARADSDYFDLGVLAAVNQALDESGTALRFIPLPALDQMMHLVIVSPQTYQRAVRAKLIPPPKYFLYKKTLPLERVNAYLDEHDQRL